MVGGEGGKGKGNDIPKKKLEHKFKKKKREKNMGVWSGPIALHCKKREREQRGV